MSFPPATEMFQFAGFASCAYGFSAGYPLRGGLPHSEIPGSTIARISPGLFAACHVLHRLSVPRHPPDALHSRLSATPNGKNHRETWRCADATPSAERCPGASRGPFLGTALGETWFRLSRSAELSFRRDKLSFSEDTSCGIARAALRAARGLPPRSHNSLLHNCPSTNATGGQATSDGKLTAAAASCRLSSDGCLVEVIGIEPTTSCLQSRRSPN